MDEKINTKIDNALGFEERDPLIITIDEIDYDCNVITRISQDNTHTITGCIKELPFLFDVKAKLELKIVNTKGEFLDEKASFEIQEKSAENWIVVTAKEENIKITEVHLKALMVTNEEVILLKAKNRGKLRELESEIFELEYQMNRLNGKIKTLLFIKEIYCAEQGISDQEVKLEKNGGFKTE